MISEHLKLQMYTCDTPANYRKLLVVGLAVTDWLENISIC